MIAVVHTDDRLTIEDGNVKASVVGTLVTVVILGGCMIGCSLAVDVEISDVYRQAGIPQTPWFTIAVSAVVLLLILLTPRQSHNRIVFDRAQGTLRLVRVTLFGTSVRREEPLASIGSAKITGSS